MIKTLVLTATMLLGTGACRSDDPDWVPISFDDEGGGEHDKPSKKSTRSNGDPDQTPKRSASAGGTADAQAIEAGNVRHLRARATEIHEALVRALPISERRLVENVPFKFDEKSGDVNAFAACTARGAALVAVTDGLMQVQAQLARAQATDEVFGTQKLDAYLAQLSRSRALLPPAGFISRKQDADPRKRRRQAQLLDEGLAFVIGHELAHHRLSHTGCVGRDHDNVTAADVGRVLARKVPLFNQPNELASDVYGIENVLSAGKKTGTGWTEGGSLLMLKAFRARTHMSLGDALVFGFERTHPHPDVRIPAVEQTARTWRLTGGRSLPKLPNLVLNR